MLKVQMFIYGYAMLLLVIVFGFTIKSTTKRSRSYKIFLMMILSNMALLVIEALTWLFGEGTSPGMRIGNLLFTTANFAFTIIPVLLVFMYFDARILTNEKSIRRRNLVYLSVAVVFFIVAVVNIKGGFLFTISSTNEYLRNDGMRTMSFMGILVLGIYLVTIYKRLKSVEGRLVALILLFSVVPVTGVILQVYFYGVPAIYSFYTLLILFTYMLIEREDAMKDTLTNLMTRGQFEQRLRYMLRRKHAFTIIMVDMDNFKGINDTYGHDEGDQTLIIVARILECETKRVDFVCRYGGDEFMILIESSDRDVGALVEARIYHALEVFNKKKVKPYRIDISYGILYVGNDQSQSEIEILTEVDRLMYVNKRRI